MTNSEEAYINKKMGLIKKNIKSLNNNYDSTKLVDEIDKWISSLNFFYNTLCGNKEPTKVIYNIPSSKRPKEGQMAYIRLGRGYPKELHDDHWCYILKDCGIKFLIIPSTSIKQSSGKCNPKYEMDIIDKTPNGKSRLSFSDIRSIDSMRLITSISPNIYDVVTSRDEIINKFQELMLTF
ncbi:MAG: hypothetical protein IJ054_03215 [Lachnospiraceae bacterium]|nr:hypothetical protein [Lachnospiraceae bacterium]